MFSCIFRMGEKLERGSLCCLKIGNGDKTIWKEREIECECVCVTGWMGGWSGSELRNSVSTPLSIFSHLIFFVFCFFVASVSTTALLFHNRLLLYLYKGKVENSFYDETQTLMLCWVCTSFCVFVEDAMDIKRRGRNSNRRRRDVEKPVLWEKKRKPEGE